MKTEKRNNGIKEYISSDTIAKELIELSFKSGDFGTNKEAINFLQDEKNRKQLIERFEKSNEIEQRLIKISQRDKIQDILLLKEKIKRERETTKLKKRRRVIYFCSSIAASILLLFGLLFFDTPPKQVGKENMITHAKQKFSVPTLILGTGKTVNLNNQITTIDKKKNIIVEKDKLKYTEQILADNKTTHNRLIVPIGYTYSIELSDGTIITVNAGGEIRYPIVFHGDKREVELVGEAYFDVTKSDIPFIVNVGNSKIKVYGTQFNVNYSHSLQFIEAVLINGSIGFNKEGEGETILEPNQKLNYDCKNNKITNETIVAQDYIAWKDGIIKHTDIQLKRVLNEISNWYGVSFQFKNDVGDMIVTLDINKNKSIEHVISFLELLLNKKIIKEERRTYTIE